MHSRGSQTNLSGLPIRSSFSAFGLAMFATLASIYVAGRLWMDAENRLDMIKELDRRTGGGLPAISVDDTFKIVACREQLNKLAALEKGLESAKHEGFISKNSIGQTRSRKMVVIGIMTSFGRKQSRDAIRRNWIPTGSALRKFEREKGIVIRFVIGRSENRGDNSDKEIDIEDRQTNDFIIIDNLVEGPQENSKKVKLFFVYAVEKWEAEFYAKINDDIFVNIDAFITSLTSHLDKPRAYIGCMKSGEVFSTPTHLWYEPEWWKFGDKKSYFLHASGEVYVISRALALFISINRDILHTYAHDDVSTGSWFIGVDVKHVDERRLCCSSWSSGIAGAVCSTV